MLIDSITARFRVIGTLACCVGTTLLGCGGQIAGNVDDGTEQVGEALVTDMAVYTNTAPASSWQDWSWSTTVALANGDAPLASGSTTQIKATGAYAGAALSLAHWSGDLATGDYDAISFDVRAPSSSSVLLAVQTLGGDGGTVQVNVPVTTTWTRQTVKLTALQGGLATFGKIDWIATKSAQTFYVDNVKLVAKASTSTTTTTTSITSSFPTAPLAVTKNDVVTLYSSAGPYSLYVPSSYDATHKTPTKLLLWMHGCGGEAYGDAWEISPGGTQSWISVSVGGRDDTCWNPGTDVPMVLAALDDVKRRLNVDPHRVVIGGYSSGGDMAYRTAFYNAKRFAGIIAENTSPFRDTGSSQSSSLAAAGWKFNVAHLAHLSDTTYPIGPVRTETDTLTANGFPMTRIERPGTHWDPETSSSGTDYDMRTYLLRYLDSGWTSP